MTVLSPDGPPPDGSRDRRIEDPTNLWVIHPAGRALLPFAIRWRVSANAVSVMGLMLGGAAAAAYADWDNKIAVLAGLLLSVAWLIADGLDGMVARATGTASALGRALDGMCDHGVFALIYVTLAWSIGTGEAWAWAVLAGAAHAVQSSLFEGERARYHRRIKGIAAAPLVQTSRNPLVILYDRVATLPDRMAAPFERDLAAATDPLAFGRLYGERAALPMRLMALLSANVRVWTVAVACLIGNPRLFWWVEIGPLSLILIVTLLRHRQVERSLVRRIRFSDREPIATALSTREHRHS